MVAEGVGLARLNTHARAGLLHRCFESRPVEMKLGDRPVEEVKRMTQPYPRDMVEEFRGRDDVEERHLQRRLDVLKGSCVVVGAHRWS